MQAHLARRRAASTRGLSLGRVGAEKRIPVILLHSDEDGGVSQNMVAKIFTEINTLSKI